jgi:hypothetical protein
VSAAARRAQRRMRAGAGALVLVCVVGLAIASLAGSAGAASAGCVWQRHAKRVVKHVKRHGKATKVERVKHFWTCEPLPEATVPPVVQPLPVPTPPPTPPAEPAPELKANAIAVVADDENTQGIFSYRVLAEEPRTGPLTLQLQNDGEDPHNLNIQAIGPGGPEGKPIDEIEDTAPGAQNTKVIELPPGEYRMFCSIGHHAEHGMEARIVIK